MSDVDRANKHKTRTSIKTITMKTIKLILLTLLISSCSKSWVCTTVMTSETMNTSFTTEFKGTTAEAHTLEDETTYTTPMFNGDDINQVTTCLKK